MAQKNKANKSVGKANQLTIGQVSQDTKSEAANLNSKLRKATLESDIIDFTNQLFEIGRPARLAATTIEDNIDKFLFGPEYLSRDPQKFRMPLNIVQVSLIALGALGDENSLPTLNSAFDFESSKPRLKIAAAFSIYRIDNELGELKKRILSIKNLVSSRRELNSELDRLKRAQAKQLDSWLTSEVFGGIVRESTPTYEDDRVKSASSSDPLPHSRVLNENTGEQLKLPPVISTKEEAIKVIQQTLQFLYALTMRELFERKSNTEKGSSGIGAMAIKEMATGDPVGGVRILRQLFESKLRENSKFRRPELSEINKLLKGMHGVKVSYVEAKQLFEKIRLFAEVAGVNFIFANKPVSISIIEGKHSIAVAKIREIGSASKKKLDTAKYDFPAIKLG